MIGAGLAGYIAYRISDFMWHKERRKIELKERAETNARYCMLLHSILDDIVSILPLQLELAFRAGSYPMIRFHEPLALEALAQLYCLTSIRPNHELVSDIAGFYRGALRRIQAQNDSLKDLAWAITFLE